MMQRSKMNDRDERHVLSRSVATLPVNGYHLVEINDDDGTSVDDRVSEPVPVLGFVIEIVNDEGYAGRFHPHAVTALNVYRNDGVGNFALIRPDGKVDYCHFEDHVFESLHDLKQYLRMEAHETYKQAAADFLKDGDKKSAASMARCSKQHLREWEEEDD